MGKQVDLMALSIETERLYLRRLELGDIDDIYSIAEVPSTAKHLKGLAELSVEGVKQFIEFHREHLPHDLGLCFDLAIELKDENKVIGLVSLINNEHQQGQLGFVLNVLYQRQGFASEAVRAVITFGFKELHLHRIFAQMDRKNISSWMLLERVGMRREAFFQHDRFEEGEWHDTFIYAILEDEWREDYSGI
jgi:RimJ/RimL family protein N-acetyltransferase